MNPWAAFVDLLAAAMVATGNTLGGGPAVGILVAAFVFRAALVPLLGPLGIRTREHQRVLRKLRPQIKALDREFRDDPRTLSARLKALHSEHGIGTVDWHGLLGALLQLPIFIALFQAVLTVWEPEAMTAAGLALGMVAGGVSLLGTKLSDQATGTAMLAVFALLPVAICLWLGAGIGFYLVGFYAAVAIQGLVMRRTGQPGTSAGS